MHACQKVLIVESPYMSMNYYNHYIQQTWTAVVVYSRDYKGMGVVHETPKNLPQQQVALLVQFWDQPGTV